MKPKVIALILFFTVSTIDVIGVILPNTFNRQVTTFLPFPMLIVVFIFYAKISKPLHLTALSFTFFGVCFFNSAFGLEERMGLVFYTIGVIIYIYNIFKVRNLFSLSSVVKYAVIFILVLIIPTLFYLNYIDKILFYPIVLYINCVGLLFYITLLSYINQKTNYNKALLLSGILLVLSTIFGGYNFFVGKKAIISMLNISTFLLAHFFMTRYVILEMKADTNDVSLS